jgi:hypothetical protein
MPSRLPIRTIRSQVIEMNKPFVSLVFVMFFSVSAAQAAGGRAKGSGTAAKEKAAKKACAKADVDTGIDILADLYVESGEITFVFNQGRCYEQNHRWEEAIDRFREYLRKAPDASEKDKADANAHIADCEAFLAKQGGGSASPAQGSASRASAVATQPVIAAPFASPTQVQAPVAVIPSQTEAHGSDGRTLRIVGAVTTVVGLCAVGTGVVLALKEQSLTNEINTKFSQSKESTRASYETWGYVSYGVGAAAIMGGAVLYYLGWRSGQSESASTGISLLPTLTPDAMTFVLHGSF